MSQPKTEAIERILKEYDLTRVVRRSDIRAAEAELAALKGEERIPQFCNGSHADVLASSPAPPVDAAPRYGHDAIGNLVAEVAELKRLLRWAMGWAEFASKHGLNDFNERDDAKLVATRKAARI